MYVGHVRLAMVLARGAPPRTGTWGVMYRPHTVYNHLGHPGREPRPDGGFDVRYGCGVGQAAQRSLPVTPFDVYVLVVGTLMILATCMVCVPIILKKP